MDASAQSGRLSQPSPGEEAEPARGFWRAFKCTGGAGLQAVWSRNKPNRTRTECWGQRGSLTAGAGRGRPHMLRGREAEERRAGKMTPATPRAPASIACGCTCPGGAQGAGGGGEDQPRALRGLHRPSDGGSAHPSAAAAGVGLGGPSGRPREPAWPRPRAHRPSVSLRPRAGRAQARARRGGREPGDQESGVLGSRRAPPRWKLCEVPKLARNCWASPGAASPAPWLATRSALALEAGQSGADRRSWAPSSRSSPYHPPEGEPGLQHPSPCSGAGWRGGLADTRLGHRIQSGASPSDPALGVGRGKVVPRGVGNRCPPDCSTETLKGFAKTFLWDPSVAHMNQLPAPVRGPFHTCSFWAWRTALPALLPN